MPQPQPWKVLQSQTVHKTLWIEILEDQCVVNNQEVTYTYTRRVDEGPLMIAEENDGSLWLVQQYRHPIKKVVWQFPVEGKLVGESWEDAAKRGLQEELKLTADTWHEIGEFHPDPGGLDQKYRAYIAQNLHPITETEVFHLDGEVEDLRVKNFSLAEIEAMIQNGQICDNWTLAGLFLYDRFKKSSSSV